MTLGFRTRLHFKPLAFGPQDRPCSVLLERIMSLLQEVRAQSIHSASQSPELDLNTRRVKESKQTLKHRGGGRGDLGTMARQEPSSMRLQPKHICRDPAVSDASQ